MRERAKNAALAGLFVLMIFLLYLSLTLGIEREDGLLARVFGAAETGEEVTLQPRSAIELRTLAVCTPNGVRMPENSSEKEEMQSAVSAIYAEAVGSAGEAQVITRRQYLELFRTPAVYFGFDAELPLFLLRAWVGFDGGERDSRLRGLVVAADGEQVSVAWYDTAAGQYCMSPTAAGVDRLTQACSLWNESNAVFAFQDADFAALCADEPVLLRAGAETKYSVLPPAFAEAGELSRELLGGFGLNPYLARVYAEAAGDRVYVENYNALGYNALRMSAKGELTYTAGAAGQGISLGLSEEETGDWSLLVEGVRALLSNLNAQAGASGTYSLSEIVQEQNGELTLLFDLTLGGYAVVAERPAAHAVVQNGQVVYLRMSPVRCEASGTQSILPARQAVAALRGGHDLRLNVRYMEKENGVLTPVLCSAEE